MMTNARPPTQPHVIDGTRKEFRVGEDSQIVPDIERGVKEVHLKGRQKDKICEDKRPKELMYSNDPCLTFLIS